MPDWTYQPLRPIAAALIGQRRTQVLALRLLNVLVTRVGGRRWIPAAFDHPAPIPDWDRRFGASVPPWIAGEAVQVLAVQGATIIEVKPVTATDIDVVRRAAAGRRCRVTATTDSPEVAATLAGDVDAVTVGDPAGVVRFTTPDIAAAVAALAEPSTTVLANPAVLLAAGPGWFNRVIEAATPTTPAPPLRQMPVDPRRWPGWLWAALVGIGLIVAGLGAAAITLGPVLLWYDRNYLGYTHFEHLAPVYVLVAATAVALALSKGYLTEDGAMTPE